MKAKGKPPPKQARGTARIPMMVIGIEVLPARCRELCTLCKAALTV